MSVHWPVPQIGVIAGAQHGAHQLHLVFFTAPSGPHAIRHTEVSEDMPGLTRQPLARQQMTVWEVNTTPEGCGPLGGCPNVCGEVDGPRRKH